MTAKPKVKIGGAYSAPWFEERLSDGSYRCRRHHEDADADAIQRAFLTPRETESLIRFMPVLLVLTSLACFLAVLL